MIKQKKIEFNFNHVTGHGCELSTRYVALLTRAPFHLAPSCHSSVMDRGIKWDYGMIIPPDLYIDI